ncbi:MAG: hypothetical protein ACRCZI_14940 [Cetobacterium sp.]
MRVYSEVVCGAAVKYRFRYLSNGYSVSAIPIVIERYDGMRLVIEASELADLLRGTVVHHILLRDNLKEKDSINA